MSEMVERSARAIYESLGGGDPQATPWADLREKHKDGFRDNARAVIEAMREPTAPMVDAGYEGGGDTPDPSHIENAWRAMVDEALK